MITLENTETGQSINLLEGPATVQEVLIAYNNLQEESDSGINDFFSLMEETAIYKVTELRDYWAVYLTTNWRFTDNSYALMTHGSISLDSGEEYSSPLLIGNGPLTKTPIED